MILSFIRYHFTQVQLLEPRYYVPRIQFCLWLLNKDLEEYHYLIKILYIDKSTFASKGVFNIRNMRHWTQENPRVTRERSFERRFHMKVWETNLLQTRPFHLTGSHYLDLIQLSICLHFWMNYNSTVIMETVSFSSKIGLLTFPLKYGWITQNYPTWLGHTYLYLGWPRPFSLFGEPCVRNICELCRGSEKLIKVVAQSLRHKLTFTVTERPMRKPVRVCMKKGGRQFEQEIY